MENKKYKDNRIVVLRFLACLLITNSHCGDLYPISLLAIGGGQGNVIFFVLSGYCLANINIGFREWIKKRANRILPATIIFLLLRIILIDGKSEFANKICRFILVCFCNIVVLCYFLFCNKGTEYKKIHRGAVCICVNIYSIICFWNGFINILC